MFLQLSKQFFLPEATLAQNSPFYFPHFLRIFPAFLAYAFCRYYPVYRLPALFLQLKFFAYKLKKLRLLIISLAIVLLAFNLTQQKAWGTGSNLINQTANVSRAIGEIAEGKSFNFALLSTGNSDHAYRYFLEIMDRTPKRLEDEVTEQLIVICENPDAVCQPLGNPLWEIAGFGRAEIVSETKVDPGIRILKLIHHKDSEDLIGKPAPRGG